MSAALPDWDDAVLSHSPTLYPTSNTLDGHRAIRPLPKRQRLLSHSPPPSALTPANLSEASLATVMPSLQGTLGSSERDDAHPEDGLTPRFDPVADHQPALERRSTSINNAHRDPQLPQHRPRRPPSDEGFHHREADEYDPSDGGGAPEEDQRELDAHDCGGHDHDSASDEEDEERAPGSFPFFGEIGSEIRKALRGASKFSAAGLFGGLGLAGMHPSLAPPASDAHSHHHHHHHHHHEWSDEGEEDHDCGSAMVPRREAVLSSGGNKKKRKIPGVTHGPIGDDDDRGFEDEGIAEPVSATSPGAKPGFRHDFGSEPLKIPTDTPTTAKAALAKLRTRPPHISLIADSYTHRRYCRRRYRFQTKLHPPLPLPEAVPFIPPPPSSYNNGPPPLPPGSGLKGSKALKAAKKAERDRAREKERIKALLGGDKIVLPNLWDPLGRNSIPFSSARAPKRRTGAEVKSGYLTPPASASSDGETEFNEAVEAAILAKREPVLLSRDDFPFETAPPLAIDRRWRALQDEIVRIRVAKERAALAREEERERREKQAKEDELNGGTDNNASAPPPLPHRHSTSAYPADADASANVAFHPSVEPISDRLVPSATLHPSSTSDNQLLPPLSNNPTTGNRKPPPKKGKKKRSAHANANNVHHRDNYIPSRLPTAPANGHGGEGGAGALTSWPASDEAMAKAGRGDYDGTGPKLALGQDEWLCSFCEYELFFGEESQLAKAVRKRKNVLKVRRRARERAAKATNGGNAASAGDTNTTPAALAAAST